MKNGKLKWIIPIIILFFIASSIKQPTISEDWQRDYQVSLQEQTITKRFSSAQEFVTEKDTDPKNHLAVTSFYNYNNPRIQSISNNIAKDSISAKNAAEAAAEYVYQNLMYLTGEADSICLTRNAAQILDRGIGQCDTQSTVLIAILRGMGIAARPVGGCVWWSASPMCITKFSFFSTIGRPLREPKFKDITREEIETGKVGRAGYLHLWVEVWLPDYGWVPMEATAGQYITDKCYFYDVEMYVEDNDRLHMCVSTNMNYANWCRIQ